MGNSRKTVFLLFLFLFLFISPSLGEEKLQVRGDTMRFLRQEDLMILEGHVVLEYRDLLIIADFIEMNTRTNSLLARGNVSLREKGQYIECQELKYYLEENASIFYDARARFHDEEKGEDLFFFSPSVTGDGEKYDIFPADLTPCDLEEPHIFFRASEVVVYPRDYLIAHNVVFYELGGRLPLFYWPVLYLSLDDEQDIIPSVGYSEERGWYIRLAYHYFSEETRGIYYLDYYSRTGLGTGFRHYYLNTEVDEGFFYFYLLENREMATGWDYFQADLSHRQLIGDWRTAFATNYHLIPENRERLDLSLNTSRSWDNSRLDYRGELKGDHRLRTEVWNRSLLSKGNYRLSLPYNSIWDVSLDHRLLEDDEGFFQIVQGDTQLTQRGSAHTVELLFERDRPQRYVRDAPPRFTALPELSLTVNPARLYPLQPPLNRYLNPLAFLGLVANYREEATDMEGIKLQGEYRYQQTVRPFRPLSINVRHSGYTSLYFVEDTTYLGPDNVLEVSDTRVGTGLRLLPGLNLGLDYNLRLTHGDTPFSFDRTSEREDVAGNLTYSWNTGQARLSSSYNLLTEKYGDLRGDLTLNPIQEVRMEVTATYSIEEQAFKGLVAKSRLNFETIKHDLAVRVDREWEIEQVDTELLWDIGEIFELGLRARYHPKEQEFRRGEVIFIWNLHCRQISLSYDHLKEEYWMQYSIPAFPGQKASLGHTPEDPMLFDLDLGGFIDD